MRYKARAPWIKHWSKACWYRLSLWSKPCSSTWISARIRIRAASTLNQAVWTYQLMSNTLRSTAPSCHPTQACKATALGTKARITGWRLPLRRVLMLNLENLASQMSNKSVSTYRRQMSSFVGARSLCSAIRKAVRGRMVEKGLPQCISKTNQFHLTCPRSETSFEPRVTCSMRVRTISSPWARREIRTSRPTLTG